MTDPVSTTTTSSPDRWWLKVVVLAFLAMCLQDVLATSMVVFEAHYRAVLAGVFDMAYWTTGLFTTVSVAIEISRNGWSRRAAILLVAINAGNFIGTIGGVHLAKALS